METPQATSPNPYTIPLDKILHRLREMFGEDRAQLLRGAEFRVAGETERVVAFPQQREELSEMLELAHRERWRVIPAGAGTWLEMGNKPTQMHLVISTARLNRVVEYEPADLTGTVEAGCSLTEFNQLTAKHRQFIPLDPFGDPRLTIGGTIATASSGPLRCAYGTPRDWLVGITVVHADGKISKAGGKVVKNVAGYDLCKLYTGSYGTLAMIAEMSFKLRALPASEKTMVFYADDQKNEIELLSTLAVALSDSDVQPAAMEFVSPGHNASLPLDPHRHALVLRFLNEPETINAQIDDATRIGGYCQRSVLSEADAARFWTAYHESETADDWAYSFRLSALPAELPGLVADLTQVLPDTHVRAHAGNGVVRVLAPLGWLDNFKTKERARKVAEVRRAAQARGGQLLILRATPELTAQLDVWGEVGPTANLMRALKDKYDPQSQLNPGRFVAGI
ncbi:MAG: FAD-binding oxidoreductase [Acidobacteria bacterium]|nr:FAD-binding oxidoreductase [Acidobacteriota bacterium]